MENGAINFNDHAEETVMIPLRKETAKLLNTSYENICCGSSCTELLNSVAWGIMPSKGENVVSCSASFPSTVYPWHRIAMTTGCEIRLAEHDENFYTDLK